MSNTLKSLYGFVPGFIIDGKQGLIQAAQNTIAALGGPISYGLYVGSALIRDIIGSPRPAQSETAIKSAIPDRISAFGRSRIHLTYALYTTASNGTAIDAGALHDGRIDGYERFYLGDRRVATTTGVVAKLPDGAYKGSTVEIDARLGLPTETAFSALTTLLPSTCTSDHRGDGVATMCVTWKPVKSKDYQETYPNAQPPPSAVARWLCCFDWRDEAQDVDDPATWQWTENAVLHLAYYELRFDNKDWETHFLPTLDYWTAAADDCDLPIPLKGVQTILAAGAEDGDDNIQVASVNGLIAGMTIAISATGDTSLTETRTVSGISALTISFSPDLSHDHPQGSQVSWASDSGSPATEPRYRSCVAFKHTDQHKGVVANLLACFDGWMSPRADGALVVYSGRYYEPTVTIGPGQILNCSIQEGVDEESSVNQIAVSYVSANHDFSTVDTDAWEDTDDISARGKILPSPLSNQVPSHSQARRLAKRAIADAMASVRGTTITNAAGRIAIGQRYVRQQVVEAGTTFMDATVQIKKLTRNITTGGVTYEWVLADPNVDAWNPATEEGEPAPVGNRVALAPIAAPTITEANIITDDNSADDNPGARILLTVSGPDRDDLTWFARWRVQGGSIWNEQPYGDIDPGSSVELLTGFVPVNAIIEIEAAYSVGDGRVSPWSTLFEVTTTLSVMLAEDGEIMSTEDGQTMIEE